MPWMKVDLKVGSNWLGMPGIIYDHNNAVIDTVSDFATYIDSISLSNIVTFAWWNPCTSASPTWSRMPYPPYWSGIDFNIYPGQGLEVQVSSANVILPLKFGQGYKKHLICNDGSDDFYCEWSGQEEFNSLEG